MIYKIFIEVFAISFSNVVAQLEVNTVSQIDNDLENLLISELFGCSVEINNIEYIGHSEALGTFNYTPNSMCSGNFGLDRGVLMTTGMINYAVGPNNNGDDGEEWNVEYEDAFFHNYLIEHQVITPSVDLFDACVLEFDISSTSSLSIDFEVIFGSEEYTEWMSPFYADAFAFFVTEINGDIDPYFNENPINIMETDDILNVPDLISCEIENKPISAWTIRPESDVFGMPGLNECLYIDNENGAFCDAIGYDGYTIPMLFNLSLEPSANYHIKMVIIDGVVDYFAGLDSGIFIKNSNLSEGVIADALLPLFDINIAGDTVSFNQTNVLANGIDYAWDFNGDGIVDSNEINPIYIFDSPGNYTVNLDYIDVCTGIVSSVSYDIIIGGTYSLLCESSPLISVFPNPAQDNLYISLVNLTSESLIQICDLSGRVVYQNVTGNNFHSIDLTSLLSGIYYVVIDNELNNINYIEKLLIF
jgi:hypothetical protein